MTDLLHDNISLKVSSSLFLEPKILFSKRGITTIAPSVAFEPYLDTYTIFQSDSLPHKLRVYPQNYTEIWLHFAQIPGARNAQQDIILPSMSIIGPNSKPIEYHFRGKTDSIHIAFRLGGDVPFLTYSPIDYDANPIALADVLPLNRIQQLHDLEGLAPIERIVRLELLLSTWFNNLRVLSRRTKHGLCLIDTSHGNIKVADVASSLNLSERQTLRSFKMETGLTPKSIARMYRFCGTIRHINQEQKPSISAIAYEHGYTDQSRLIRDFVQFSGITPSQFLARRSLSGLHQEWEPYT